MAELAVTVAARRDAPEGVRAVYSGRDGGTDDALDAALSFFEVIHHLKDWLGNDASSGLTRRDGDELIAGSPTPEALRRPRQRFEAFHAYQHTNG